MATKPPYKKSGGYKGKRQDSRKPTNRFQEFKPRKLPRGAHFTVYDLQGSNIDPLIVERIEKAIETIVLSSGVPTLGIDVRKG